MNKAEYHKLYMRKWHKSPKGREYRKIQRLQRQAQIRAYRALKKAVSSGAVIRPDKCSECGKVDGIEGHHYLGYAHKHYRDVQWLCTKCHNAVHQSEKWAVQSKLLEAHNPEHAKMTPEQRKERALKISKTLGNPEIRAKHIAAVKESWKRRREKYGEKGRR